MRKKQNILIVGAGFAGAVVARSLADSGYFNISIIDQRDHIAGNAYDTIDPSTGVRYHVYGPHIFHTNDSKVVDYLSRFTEWYEYRHRVKALVENIGAVPLPVNIETLNIIYSESLSTPEEMRGYLDKIRSDVKAPSNAREYLLSIYGEELTELFFSRYTRKMWALDLSDLPVSIVSRLPLRYDNNPYYFNDKYQLMPGNGYTRMIENILDHEDITVNLDTLFDKSMENDFDHVFNSMPIDVYFDEVYGPLPYRSIRFEHEYISEYCYDVPTVNFTDTSDYTRMTNWSLYPGHGSGEKLMLTREVPCSYEENNFERYYPVKSIDGEPQKIYKKYRALAKQLDYMTFIGRCGQYIYYDMDQVVANSRKFAMEYMDLTISS